MFWDSFSSIVSFCSQKCCCYFFIGTISCCYFSFWEPSRFTIIPSSRSSATFAPDSSLPRTFGGQLRLSSSSSQLSSYCTLVLCKLLLCRLQYVALSTFCRWTYSSGPCWFPPRLAIALSAYICALCGWLASQCSRSPVFYRSSTAFKRDTCFYFCFFFASVSFSLSRWTNNVLLPL